MIFHDNLNRKLQQAPDSCMLQQLTLVHCTNQPRRMHPAPSSVPRPALAVSLFQLFQIASRCAPFVRRLSLTPRCVNDYPTTTSFFPPGGVGFALPQSRVIVHLFCKRCAHLAISVRRELLRFLDYCLSKLVAFRCLQLNNSHVFFITVWLW